MPYPTEMVPTRGSKKKGSNKYKKYAQQGYDYVTVNHKGGVISVRRTLTSAPLRVPSRLKRG